MTRSDQRSAPEAKRLPSWLPITIIGGVFIVIIALTVAGRGSSTGGSSNSESASVTLTQTQPVEVSGVALPPRPEGPDPAVGTKAPEISGFDFAGNPVSFTNGAPRAVVYLAHWCPHCQAEVNELTAYLSNNEWPDVAEVQTISTWVDSSRGNYPPSEWLHNVSWPFTVLADDESFSAADALGLSGTPMWVFIAADGTVVERTGGLGPELLLEKLAALSG